VWRVGGHPELGGSISQKLLVLMLALLLASTYLPFTVGQSMRVYGVVKDTDGNPIRGMTVTVYDGSGSVAASTQTLVGGDFSVSLDRGTYRAQLEKRGYESKSVSFSVTRDQGVMNLGETVLDYSLKVSITQTYLRVSCLSEVSTPISLSNKGSEDEPVSISVEAPDGWDAGVYSGEAEVKGLTLSPGEVQTLDLRIFVPYKSSGLHNLTIRAFGWTIQGVEVSLYVDKVDPQIISSRYPTAQATLGSTVLFDLTIKNPLAKRFTGLISVELPDGWSGSAVREDGGGLYGVSLDPGESVKATVRLDVPTDEPPGDYEIKIIARSEDLESSLLLHVIVVMGVPNPRLRTDTPYIDAYAGGTANYLISVENTGSSGGIVGINMTGLPVGYNWVIKDASGNVLSKLYLKAGESKQLSAVISVPPLAEPDIVSFTLEASVGEAVDRLNLGLGILGWYNVAYVTQNFYSESVAGATTVFTVVVKNTGYSSLSNARLEVSTVPSKFTVEVNPSVVLLLKPQESATFSLTITTNADITAGDYYITLSVKADQSQVPDRSLHVYVKQSGEVVYVGAGIGIVLAVALFLIYRKYGRR